LVQNQPISTVSRPIATKMAIRLRNTRPAIQAHMSGAKERLGASRGPATGQAVQGAILQKV
jgi:hypothetical protein